MKWITRLHVQMDCVPYPWLIITAVLLGGCSGQPQTRFSPTDSNVAAGQSSQFTFDSDPVGGLPKGAEIFSGSWAVRAEPDAPSQPNALCQTGTATFPALSLGDAVYTDVVMSVRFKPISGREDQAAGIIFRIQDKNNYYILRANALENNVNFYKYASGIRSGIKEAGAKVLSGQWQELRVAVTGNRMQGFLNGQLINEASDDSYKAGKVGLWTKADSVTCFDNVQVSPTATGTQIPMATATIAAPTRAVVPAVTLTPDLTAPHATVAMTSFSFSPSTLRVRVGQPIRLDLQNTDMLNHQFAIDDSDVEVTVPPGSSQRLDFVMSKPGTYTFACNLVEEGNHRALGMLGTLIVDPAP